MNELDDLVKQLYGDADIGGGGPAGVDGEYARLNRSRRLALDRAQALVNAVGSGDTPEMGDEVGRVGRRAELHLEASFRFVELMAMQRDETAGTGPLTQ